MDRNAGEQGRIIVIRRSGSVVVCSLYAADVQREVIAFLPHKALFTMNMLHNSDVLCMRLHTAGRVYSAQITSLPSFSVNQCLMKLICIQHILFVTFSLNS